MYFLYLWVYLCFRLFRKKPCEEDNYDWVDLEYLNSMYKNWGGV